MLICLIEGRKTSLSLSLSLARNLQCTINIVICPSNMIWECTRLLPNEIYSVSVKYIFDYKVKFLRYTRTYSLNGRGRRGMIKTNFFLEFIEWSRFVSFCFSVYIFCFVSFLSLQILFRFVVFRFVSLCFVSFRCVSFLFRFSLYRDPQNTEKRLKV